MPPRVRTSKTPPINSSSSRITYTHYSNGDGEASSCFRESDLMMDMETDISSIDMGLNGYHGMRMEHDNDPLIGVGFGIGDECRSGRSRGDVFLGVGIDIEMGPNGYGMHQSPSFHHAGRQPEHSHHPSLFGHSPQHSHSQQDLDIISLLNESSFDGSSASASNSRNVNQTSPSLSHKAGRNGIISSSSHSPHAHEIYAGLGDYGMGSLYSGDHSAVSPAGMRLGRGIPTNLGIGIIASP